MYLATTWNNPPRWGTLWGGELHAEIQFVGTKISTECSLFPIKSLESINDKIDECIFIIFLGCVECMLYSYCYLIYFWFLLLSSYCVIYGLRVYMIFI